MEDTKKNEGRFVLKQRTKFKDLVDGYVTELPESDLCFQNESDIIQLKFEKAETETKYIIEPGTYVLSETNQGLRPMKIELRQRNLLSSIDNTRQIINEAKTFFKRLHVYETLGRDKKRAVLLFSKPGLGKSSAITKACHDFIEEDPGTVVFNWPTSEVEADTVNRFLSVHSAYSEKATRLVLIIEDIGGGDRDGSNGPSGVPSGLLDFLDGIGVAFKLPTFIIATTNHPENLLESLADRPGRFDLMVELQPPSLAEKVELLKFIAKRPITAEEEKALSMKGAESFSIAHLEEVVVRSLLHDKTIPVVIKELVDHSAKYKRGFEKKRGSLGMGAYED